jgi:hypothetical protein
VAQSASLLQGMVQSLRPSAGSGSSSETHLPTRQLMSVSQMNPRRPGMQMAGLAGPEIFWKQTWFGGQFCCESQLGTQMSGACAEASTSSGRQDCPGEQDEAPLWQFFCKQ